MGIGKTANEASSHYRNSTWIEKVIGVSFVPENTNLYPPNYEKAASYYQVAAEVDHSSLAMYNLGYMHENGLGVVRDFHLAKRLYDQSASTNPGASLAVNLALVRLMAKWYASFMLDPLSFVGDGSTTIFGQKETQNDDGLPPAPEMPDDLKDINDIDPMKDNLLLLLLLALAGGLVFWRQRIEHQRLAEQQQLDAARTAALRAQQVQEPNFHDQGEALQLNNEGNGDTGEIRQRPPAGQENIE